MTEPLIWREETRKLTELKPYTKNPRRITKIEFEKLKTDLTELGYHTRIKIDIDNTMNDGHQKWKALQELGLKEVQVLVPNRKLTEDEFDKILIKSNTHSGVWDTDILANNWEAPLLVDWGVDVPGLFEEVDEVKVLEGEDDEVTPDLNKQPTSKYGDIWILGNHRLMCGDSTKYNEVEKLFNGEKASIWASDPPYGINHVKTSQEKGQSKGYGDIENDDLQDDEFKDFIYEVIVTSLPFMKDNFAFYMWHAMKMQGYTAAAAAAAAAAAGILFHRQIIWVKPQLVFGRGHYHWRHELCLMGWLKGKEPPFYGERNQTSVWEIGRENDKIHPTQKPVAIWEPSILNHTKQGEIIYEPFCGSGSNIVACEKTNRRCFAMELFPHYCDIIIQRWEKLTGGKAKIERGV